MQVDNKRPLVPANIENLKPYVAGKTIAEVEEKYHPPMIAKLASNENRLGCSPRVKKAVAEALAEIQDYPDPIARKLRARLAEMNGLQPENIILGNGSESILSIVTKTFFLEEDIALTADATFVGFFVQAGIHGVEVERLPLAEGYRFDLEAMANAINGKTKLVYIANPNNPTGTYITRHEFEAFMGQVPEDVVVVMDEAYFEFARHLEDYPNSLDYDYPNVLTLRTFSKAYGLAGFRIGYGMGPESLVSYMMKTKLTFEPSTPAQAAALAALDDVEFLERSIEVVEEGKKRLYEFFEEQGVEYVQTAANAVMMVLRSEEEARHFTEQMQQRGVILRQLTAFGLPNCVRITIGVPREMEHFEASFKEVYNR